MASTAKEKSHISGETETPLTSDPCVCSAWIGAIYIGTTNRIFVRVDNTNPCNVNDWVELTNVNGGFTFRFTGDDATLKNVSSNDNITLDGINGLSTTISGNTISINGHLYSSSSNPSGTPTDPSQVSFHLNTTSTTLFVWKPSTSTWVSISKPETVTTLVNNNNGTYTYTNESGVAVTFAIANAVVTTLTNNNDGTITYLNELGNPVIIDIVAIMAQYLDLVSSAELDGTILKFKNLDNEVIITVDLATLPYRISPNAGNKIQSLSNGLFASETVTTLVANDNGTFSYTNEVGTVVTINAGTQTITTLVNNNNGTYTYTNESGVQTIIDVSASSLVINPSSTIGANYAITAASISGGALLLQSKFDHDSEKYISSNTALTVSPIPLSALNQTPIVLVVTNPSSVRDANAQITFSGYPLQIKTGTTNNVIVQVEQSLTINSVVPSDYVNLPIRHSLTANREYSLVTQPYTTTIVLTPGQTAQVEINLDITII